MTDAPDHPTPPVDDLADAVRTGALAAQDVVDHALARAEAVNPGLEIFRVIDHDGARSAAEKIDERIRAGDDPGPLAGVPVAVKDNIAIAGLELTCGSRFLEGYRSPFTATAVEKLRDAGAVVIGTTHCDEFGMGSSSEHCAHATPRNPWDPERTPGGSSGGSAAAVAAGCCPLTLGSDTGGSVRQPAAFCGAVGLKPTYGRVSRYGLVAFASSLDQIGPIASDVRGAAAGCLAVAGLDPRDATSLDREIGVQLDGLDRPIPDLRVGLPREYDSDRNDPDVAGVLGQAASLFRSLGATIVDVDLTMTSQMIAVYYVIAPAEASSNLARFDGVRYGRRADAENVEALYRRSRAEGFGPEVQRRIMLGTHVLSSGYYDAYYGRAMKARRLIRDEFEQVFTQCDILLGPTTPRPAFRIGEVTDPMAMYMNDVYTVGANIAGHPAISLPVGTTADGRLPIGVQLQAPAFEEMRLLRAARMLEEAAQFDARPPAGAASGASS